MERMKEFTEPVVHEQVRSSVVDEQIPSTNLLANYCQDGDPCDEAQVTHPDQGPILFIEDGAGRLEMVHAS